MSWQIGVWHYSNRTAHSSIEKLAKAEFLSHNLLHEPWGVFVEKIVSIPAPEDFLPSLMQFAHRLASECKSGRLTGWRDFIKRVHDFYTPAEMEKIEQIVPGWGRMASYADQQTLIHVTSVLTALCLLPEYQQASAEQQALMKWMVLFHDVAKEVQPGKHDYLHAFRSAAIAGKALSRVGFPVTDAYSTLIDNWFTLTYNAIMFHEEHDENIQDNRTLPEIITGIDRMYSQDAPAGLVIKAILLHLSIVTDPNYPFLAPLTDEEIQQYVDGALIPLFKAMMLVDTDAWNLFDAAKRLHYRQQTLAVFDRIG